ncbi:30S ribosomal protein S8 [Candidatus Methylocalor cossyra]|uniref:30S ribosomal protein S8 n=1 Tax=Candidatus Methylocalor cossyra TaxID=3108543 RepID=UPI003D6D3924
MTDPLADMFTRIRNAHAAGRSEVRVPSSKCKVAICNVLQGEGYIEGFSIEELGNRRDLVLQLKYYKGKPVLSYLQRVSKAGRRVYKSVDDLPSVLSGLGTAIISTSQGIMSDREAKKRRLGGEVIGVLW